MKRLRVLVLVPEGQVPPEDLSGLSDLEIAPWKMEYDVLTALDHLRHHVRILSVSNELSPIRGALEDFKPDVVFNMLEDFHGVAFYDQNVVSYLELMKASYTGCNPRGLILCRDKALSKKLLTYHRIPVPRFLVFRRGQRVRPPRKARYPLIVKSLTEESSLGISHASLVNSDEQLGKRVQFVHEQIGTHAIAEEYIEGRELYVGVLGNQRLQTFPVWELDLRKLPESSPKIATARVKWDLKYQDKHGISSNVARNLPDGVAARMAHIAKRVYRILCLSGYGRVDMRLAEDGRVYVLEANPNPDLSLDEDFALSAEEAGVNYDNLIQRILNLGLRYQVEKQL